MSLDWRKRLTVTETYGVVAVEHKSQAGKVSKNMTYNPALFAALGAIKKNGRQKRLVNKMMRAG